MYYKPEKVHRVLFKLSGEVLSGSKGFGYDEETIKSIVDDIISVKRLGVSIAIVLGGGNIFRGINGSNAGMRRVIADSIGMLATVQNSLVLSEYLHQHNINSEVYSAVQMDRFTKFYTPLRAKTSLKEGRICIICAGTGNPYFTTDTAAVLRAVELDADIVIKGTKVDGVYTSDPKKDPNAEFLEAVDFDEVLSKKLNVMDMTAFSLARDNNMPIKVFNVLKKGNFEQAILRQDVGTYVYPTQS